MAQVILFNVGEGSVAITHSSVMNHRVYSMGPEFVAKLLCLCSRRILWSARVCGVCGEATAAMQASHVSVRLVTKDPQVPDRTFDFKFSSLPTW